MHRSFILFLTACTGILGLGAAAGSAVIWLDVPFVKQEKNGCGAACLSMILQYWANHGAAVDSEAAADAPQIQRTLYRSEAEGIWAADMERYLQGEGFRTFAFRGDWQALAQHLAKGRPLIVSLRDGRGAASHCVVVAGLDEQSPAVLVNDPGRRKLLKLDRAAFEKAWEAAGSWTVLAVPGVGR